MSTLAVRTAMVVEVRETGNPPGGQWQTAEYVEQGDSTVVGPSMRFYMCGRHVRNDARGASCKLRDLAVYVLASQGAVGLPITSRTLRQEGDNNVQRAF